MIRPAEERDIPELTRLLRQVNNVHAKGRPDLFRMDCTKYTPEELAALLKRADSPVFVRTEEKTPDGTGPAPVLGYAFCQLVSYEGDHNMVDRREVYIDDICVDEAVRGRHVGQSLYQYVLDWARERAFDRITLNVWSLNPGAMKFYEAMGLTPYRVSMEKRLNGSPD